MQKIKVYKFGGASVRDDVSLRQVARIIQSAASGPLVIVLSAMGKTTNALEKITQEVFIDTDPTDSINQLKDYHRIICEKVFPEGHAVFEGLSSLFDRLASTCQAGESPNYNALYDRIVSYGERFSTLILHHFLISHGIGNTLLDSAQLVKTDDSFRAANVDWVLTHGAIREIIDPTLPKVWVVQGFIGSTVSRLPVTLGREGSDFSASIFASVLGANEVTIWKDVPGVLNADPQEGKATVKFEKMPYQEALELAFYGAKVIHPKTIKPLENNNIKLLVKPFSDPEASGTLISSDPELYPQACSAIWKQDQILFTLRPRDLSFISESHVHEIMGILAKLGIHQNLIQSSALHFSICCDAQENIVRDLTDGLSSMFHILYNEGLSLLTLRHFSDEDILRNTSHHEVVMQQQSRITFQAVVRRNRC
ncbi:MAG: aspartate kinase [Bacteroidales bacterium]|nr:aspartate kinase [Bacteroidales bacterium]